MSTKMLTTVHSERENINQNFLFYFLGFQVKYSLTFFKYLEVTPLPIASMNRLNYLLPFKLHFSLVVTREVVILVYTGDVKFLCALNNILAAASAAGIARSSQLSSFLRGQAVQYSMAGSWPA
jgi:hypothetical protein